METQALPDAPLTLGTAGHIDHGKTALVTLLTGKNTDRLREERERGISIELGYAELELPGGRRLSVVDVPGHERFVRTMVAGATGIDFFLLVIAADDGVMPQTVEHLAVLELLGVQRGVVALTKADLADDELLELARADVVEFLAKTSYAGAPLVTVSARDGRGVSELLAALDAVAADFEKVRRDGPARLPIDRVFALKGTGTVVTGTLWRGEIRAGDALLVEPGGRKVVARSVQVHDRADEAALGGRRVGVNLRGIDHGDIERGQWLVAAVGGGTAIAGPTTAFEAWVTVLGGARSLRSGERVRLHHGTAQYLARLQVLAGTSLEPGAQGAAVVRLDDGLAVVDPHDRFILRALSPVTTIGGGTVLDTRPRRWHDRAAHAAYCAALHEGDIARALALLAERAGAAGVGVADLAAVGLDEREAREACSTAEEAGELESRAGRWFVADTAAGAADGILTALRTLARERPERPQSAPAELAAQVAPFPIEALTSLLADLQKGGRVVETAGGYALVGGATLSQAQERLIAALLERLDAEPFAPPTLATLLQEEGMQRRELLAVLDVLAQRGRVVRADKDLWFTAAAVDEARRRLCEALARAPEITLAGFRDLLGTGRRNAQALLELFDREGLTRRQGDARVLRTRH